MRRRSSLQYSEYSTVVQHDIKQHHAQTSHRPKPTNDALHPPLHPPTNTPPPLHRHHPNNSLQTALRHLPPRPPLAIHSPRHPHRPPPRAPPNPTRTRHPRPSCRPTTPRILLPHRATSLEPNLAKQHIHDPNFTHHPAPLCQPHRQARTTMGQPRPSQPAHARRALR